MKCWDCEAADRPLTRMALRETPERESFALCSFCRPKWAEALVEWKPPAEQPADGG